MMSTFILFFFIFQMVGCDTSKVQGQHMAPLVLCPSLLFCRTALSGSVHVEANTSLHEVNLISKRKVCLTVKTVRLALLQTKATSDKKDNVKECFCWNQNFKLSPDGGSATSSSQGERIHLFVSGGYELHLKQLTNSYTSFLRNGILLKNT